MDEQGARFQRVNLTSGVFRWLCDIHAVRADHGEGCSAGGVVLTPEGNRMICGGAALLESVCRCQVAADAISSAGHIAQLHFRIAVQEPKNAAARLHNWQSILWIMSRLTGEDVGPDEKSLLVAQDAAVVSCVIHRLAALVALSSACKPAAVLNTKTPSTLGSHRGVQLLCRSAERHLNIASSLIEHFLLQEPEKYTYAILHPSKLSANASTALHEPAAAAAQVEEFFRDIYTRSSELVDALRLDASAIRLVLWSVSRALESTHRGSVICCARAVTALADGLDAPIVSDWFLLPGGGGGGRDLEDGLDAVLHALTRHRGDVDVALALSKLAIKCTRHENIAHLLSTELLARVGTERAGGAA